MEENDSSEESGKRTLIAKKATDFSLKDHAGRPFHLFEALTRSPALLVFYPGDYRMICTKQLCNYRDVMSDFASLPIQVIGISHNSVDIHADFVQKFNFPFILLSDPNHVVAKIYGCRSLFMLGSVSRAVMIINQKRMILYRYVEPTVLTHRSAPELLGILKDLKEHSLL